MNRIIVANNTPAQPAVSAFVEDLPSHSDGLRVIKNSDQKIYTSYNSDWIIDTPKEGWTCFDNFSQLSIIYKDGKWEAIEHVLDSEELPTEELPTEEFPSTEIIFTSEEVEGVGEQIIITETVNPDNVTYHFSLDESKIDHNNLLNWEAARHREMNYDEDIKTYLIND